MDGYTNPSGGYGYGDGDGDGYTGSPYPQPAPPSPKRAGGGTWAMVVGAVVACIVAGAVLGFVILRAADTPKERPGGIERGDAPGDIRLESVTFADQDSFTESVVAASDGDLNTFASKASFELTGGTTVQGSASGLYGSRVAAQPCDIDKFVTSLNADRSATRVWSDLMGIEISQVEDTVRSLTPVVLQADTAVTNHSYRGGSAHSFQAVLQAGTPVLIDAFGVPRVKCSCGNPLLAPRGEKVEQINGNPWADFNVDSVITIEAPKGETDSIETVDVDTGELVGTSLGGTVSLDGVLIATSSGVSVVDADGTRVEVLDRPVSAMFDDGRGGVVFTLQRSDSVDGWGSTPPGNVDEALIWYLRAGTTEAVPLMERDDPGVWFTLETVGLISGTPYAIYKSLTAETDLDMNETVAVGSLNAINLVNRESRIITESADGFEHSTDNISIGNDQVMLWESTYQENSVVLYDANFMTPDRPACIQYMEDRSLDERWQCPISGIINDGGRITSLASDLTTGISSTDSDQIIEFDLSSSTTHSLTNITFPSSITDWANQSADHRSTDTRITQVSDGQAVVTVERWSNDTPGDNGKVEYTAFIGSLADGKVIDLAPDDPGSISGIWILDAPLLRPRPHAGNHPDGTTDTTSPPAPSINLQQVAAGDYSSLIGTWTPVASATNPHNGTGEQWRSGSLSAEVPSTLVISKDAIVYNEWVTVEGNTLTVDTGNGPESAPFPFENDGKSLSAGAELGPNFYAMDVYPEGSVDVDSELGVNNGVTVDNQKDVISFWSSHNGSSNVFARTG